MDGPNVPHQTRVYGPCIAAISAIACHTKCSVFYFCYGKSGGGSTIRTLTALCNDIEMPAA